MKSEGHISIPKINPPVGVFISLNNLTKSYLIRTQRLSTLARGETYKFLDTSKYSGLGVVGGSPLVLGVSGWLLGSGYSLPTNKHGLGMDNVVGFQVIMPSATTQVQVLPAIRPFATSTLERIPTFLRRLRYG